MSLEKAKEMLSDLKSEIEDLENQAERMQYNRIRLAELEIRIRDKTQSKIEVEKLVQLLERKCQKTH